MSADSPEPDAASSPRPKKKFTRLVAIWNRWLHIYVSMFGCAAILFFSITGLTLNHSDWFFDESTKQVEGSINTEWLNLDAEPPTDWDEYDYSHEVSRLEVAEHLRSEFNLRGTVTDFLAFEDECEVTFQSPGYSATARITRETGEMTLDIVSSDLVTIMNDLHKGRHSGSAWSWVIDVSALLGTFVGLTGFLLIFFLKLQKRTGLITSLVGLAVFVYLCFVAVA